MAWLTNNGINETAGSLDYGVSEYYGDSVEYSWDFYKNNSWFASSSNRTGTLWLENLNRGKHYEITAEVTITVGTKHSSTSTNEDGSETTTVWWTYDEYGDDASEDIYTHPGSWHWSDYISQNDIIEEALKASDINDWVNHLAAWKSWKEQADWYNAYDDYYNNDTNIGRKGFKVYSGDIIYMQWFNNCAEAHPKASTISHNNNEDIISVSRLSTLDFNGTGS